METFALHSHELPTITYKFLVHRNPKIILAPMKCFPTISFNTKVILLHQLSRNEQLIIYFVMLNFVMSLENYQFTDNCII
jgi:hypothetical protein